MTPPAIDPIAQLLQDLERYGKPSLGWVVRWSAGGRDPVCAAWDASWDPGAMALLCGRVAGERIFGPERIRGPYDCALKVRPGWFSYRVGRHRPEIRDPWQFMSEEKLRDNDRDRAFEVRCLVCWKFSLAELISPSRSEGR